MIKILAILVIQLPLIDHFRFPKTYIAILKFHFQCVDCTNLNLILLCPKLIIFVSCRWNSIGRIAPCLQMTYNVKKPLHLLGIVSKRIVHIFILLVCASTITRDWQNYLDSRCPASLIKVWPHTNNNWMFLCNTYI